MIEWYYYFILRLFKRSTVGLLSQIKTTDKEFLKFRARRKVELESFRLCRGAIIKYQSFTRNLATKCRRCGNNALLLLPTFCFQLQLEIEWVYSAITIVS